MRAFATISIALVLAAVGCGGGGGGGDTSCSGAKDISGIWSGPVTNDSVSRGNPGMVEATITQSGCELGGTWNFVFADPTLDRDLLVGGNPPEGTDVAFTIGDSITDCDQFGNCVVGFCLADVRGSLVGPNEIVGTYATDDTCSQSRSGSFDIQRTAVFVPTPVPTGVPPTPTPTP